MRLGCHLDICDIWWNLVICCIFACPMHIEIQVQQNLQLNFAFSVENKISKPSGFFFKTSFSSIVFKTILQISSASTFAVAVFWNIFCNFLGFYTCSCFFCVILFWMKFSRVAEKYQRKISKSLMAYKFHKMKLSQ